MLDKAKMLLVGLKQELVSINHIEVKIHMRQHHHPLLLMLPSFIRHLIMQLEIKEVE